MRPLPFEEPERLVRIHTVPPGGTPDDLSPGKFYDWQQNAQSFEGMAMHQCCGLKELALTGTGTARMVRGIAVSAGFSRSSEPGRRSDACFDKSRTHPAASTWSS